MNEVRPQSWNELQEVLFEGSWQPSLQRFRSPFAFRGLSDVGYRLETTLMRLASRAVGVERHLLRNFRKYAHRDVVERDSIWNWLSVAQHHGLPTRLLDWTYSPFVAMHFATANMERVDADGVIWAVDFSRAHESVPEVLRSALAGDGSNVFTVEMLSRTVRSLDHFESLAREPFVLFFEPPSLDDRIVNQYALFSVISDAHCALDDWLADRPQLFRKIVVPAALKWEIRDKLDQLNITERVLFPGLDGLSTWLKRHYSLKPGPGR